MSRVVTKTVFSYEELSDKAKAYARQQHVEQPYYPHDDWWDFGDLITVAELMGVEIGQETRKTESGSTYTNPKIHFSGFSSQGDGASFEGSYKWKTGCAKDIAEYAPQDKTLKSLVERLAVLQVTTMLEHGDTLEATITRGRGSYSHSGAMAVEVWMDADSDRSQPAHVTDKEAEELASILRSLANWMYRQLNDQYDYYFDDDYLAQELQDSDTEFNEDGSVA